MNAMELLEQLALQGCSLTESQGVTLIEIYGAKVGSLQDDALTLSVIGHCFEKTRKRFELRDIDVIRVEQDEVRVTCTNAQTYRARDLPRPDSDAIVNPLPDTDVKWDISNLTDAVDSLFPEFKDFLWWDELSGMEMVDMVLFGETGITQFTDEHAVRLEILIIDRLRELGFIRIPSDVVFTKLFTLLFSRNRRNLFMERISKVEWDGVERVRGWFMDTFGATAPSIAENKKFGPEKEVLYLQEVSLRWFLGGIARNILPHGCVHEIVPVLVGPQGVGKSGGLRYTGFGSKADPAFYKATSVGAEDKIKLLEETTGGIVVELAESTQFKTASNNYLKGFISQFADTYRKAYARRPTTCPRRFILASTSNAKSLFTDSSGSRRFFPIMCDPTRISRDFKENDFNEVEQVWAEALELYRNGEQPFLDEEIEELARVVQEGYTSIPVNVDVINSALDADPVASQVGCKLKPNELLAIVQGYDTTGIIRDSDTAVLRSWLNYSPQWEWKNTSRGRTDKGRFYVRIQAPESDGEEGNE